MLTRRVGVLALLVECDGGIEAAELALRLVALAESSDGDLRAPRDAVPGSRTVLLDGLGPGQRDRWESLLAALSVGDLRRAPSPGRPAAVVARRELTIEVSYDGADLDEVASAWGCSRDAVLDRHSSAIWRVAFCGFAPGFAYCLPDHPLPEVPRRAQPRERVPGGSVALAGPYCGIYPAPMPGGWQLIGRTETAMFDPAAEPPMPIGPGDLVHFEARSRVRSETSGSLGSGSLGSGSLG